VGVGYEGVRQADAIPAVDVVVGEDDDREDMVDASKEVREFATDEPAVAPPSRHRLTSSAGEGSDGEQAGAVRGRRAHELHAPSAGEVGAGSRGGALGEAGVEGHQPRD